MLGMTLIRLTMSMIATMIAIVSSMAMSSVVIASVISARF